MALSTIASPLVSMEAKMIVTTGRDHCQQLKDVLSQEDTSSMVVVMASSNETATPIPPSPPAFMDPGLLAVACSGSWKELQSFLNGDPRPTSSDGTIGSSGLWKKLQSFLHLDPRPASSNGTMGSSAIQQASRDQEALVRVSFLDGVTVQGDTFLHVMATNSVGEDLVEDGLRLIHTRAVQVLSVQNNNGDTPLHCAARAAKSQMVSFLVELARGNDANTVKPLLKKQNNRRWTVLHEAIHTGNNDIVKLLMTEDPQLASIPNDSTSPLYLAILLENKPIAQTLYEMSGGILSYSGPNGQNALHAAVLRGKDLTTMLLGWNNALTIQQDENGSTPLHISASVLPPLGQYNQATVRLQLLRANPNALYRPDREGSFPIHVAASVGATAAIRDFIKKSPNCAGLRDAAGRTFLHVGANKTQKRTVYEACTNRSLSWILNMQDNSGNTALHLAVQTGSLANFCALLWNRKVNLSLTNEKGETPIHIARYNVPIGGLNFNESTGVLIYFTLRAVGAKWDICRQDYFGKSDSVEVRQKKILKMEIVKDSTQNLCIFSVLIATVTFAATFTMPGGYRADDHTNGGTPTLAGRYGFDAFILANTFAFAFSVMAIICLMSSGSPMYNLRTRLMHLKVAFLSVDISVTCLVAAFAVGSYMMIAPVAHNAAVAVCALSSLILICSKVEMAIRFTMVIQAIVRRRGLCHNIVLIYPLSALSFVGIILQQFVPLIVVLMLSDMIGNGLKVEPTAQPPTPYH